MPWDVLLNSRQDQTQLWDCCQWATVATLSVEKINFSHELVETPVITVEDGFITELIALNNTLGWRQLIDIISKRYCDPSIYPCGLSLHLSVCSIELAAWTHNFLSVSASDNYFLYIFNFIMLLDSTVLNISIFLIHLYFFFFTPFFFLSHTQFHCTCVYWQ